MKKDPLKKIDSIVLRSSKKVVPVPPVDRRKLLLKYSPYILLAVIIVGVLGSLTWGHYASSSKKQAAKSTEKKQDTASSTSTITKIGQEKTEQIPSSQDGKLPAYTIIQPATTPTPPTPQKSPAQEGPLRITIIVEDRSEQKLIALNDLLLKQYKAQIDAKRGFFIDYFDNKDIAARYFKTVSDSKTDKAAKAELYKHYVAIMVDSEALKMNQLYLQGTPVKSLKQY